MTKLKVNMISVSNFSLKANGVHSAFTEMTAALKEQPNIDIAINKFRRADITHIHMFTPFDLLHLLFGRSKKVVSVHIIPNSLIHDKLRGVNLWIPIIRRYMRFFYNRADATLAVSKTVLNAVQNELKVTKPHLAVMYNTVDTTLFQVRPGEKLTLRKKLGLRKTDFIVLCAGQWLPRKRLDTFVSVARTLPKVKFIWLGGVPIRILSAKLENLRQIIKTAPKNVTFAGIQPRETVIDYLKSADVFWLPAQQENHPMCVLEAAAAGLPIILRNLPEYDDTFRGHAVMADTEKKFASAISKLQTDPKYYQKYQTAASRIAKKFDSRAAATHLIKLYQDLLKT